ncbi:MAG: glycoside hydrolase family 3 C-terminal domain-containing protein [Clostridia bacterium]|nr:glycoside hydrolase family 3 C-terminal domain-containing protein [Clostridia bacterium]
MKNDLKNLTLDEKITLLTGKDAWNIHDIPKLDKFNMADGPCGLRKVSYMADGSEIRHRSTAYPSTHVLANSWNKETVKKSAAAMADDCIDENVDMLLAPGVNIKKDPRCGRNFEYFSEDPFLAGSLAKEFIDGLQEKGVGSSLKHYCCNNSEDNRQNISSVISKRALMEIYTKNFALAIKANPTTVMCSYNRINGRWASEHNENNDILYNKLGFKGAIVSDWEAVHHKVLSVKSGLALQMPYRAGMAEQVKAALESGELTEKEIDVCAGRTIDLINRIQDMKPLRKVETHLQDRQQLATEGVIDGAVFLKNNGLLPLNEGCTIGVTGAFDYKAHHGGGSAHVWTAEGIKALDVALREADAKAKVIAPEKVIAKNWHGKAHCAWRGMEEILPELNGVDCVFVQACNNRDIESEGFDRDNIKLHPVEESYIRFIGDNFKGKTVVLLYAGSAIDVSSWIDHVDALLLVGLAGERMNEAVADLVLGKVSPSGKLSETFPEKLEDISCYNKYNSYMTEEIYYDGIYVGYRHYDKNNIKPRYEFGFGLSYAKFEYSGLNVKDCGDTLKITYTVKNVSKVSAKEISEVYMASPAKAIDRPLKELIGYSKDYIPAGESKEITVIAEKENMRYFDEGKDDFVFENGEYNIMVGASSRDIKLEKKINL